MMLAASRPTESSLSILYFEYVDRYDAVKYDP